MIFCYFCGVVRQARALCASFVENFPENKKNNNPSKYQTITLFTQRTVENERIGRDYIKLANSL
jgi:hypothetical protein